MRTLSLVLMLFISRLAYSESTIKNVEQLAQEEYQIDWKYRAGEYLIYDCDRAHYACVNKSGQENCIEERKFAIATKEKTLKCAPLKVFVTKKECIQKSYLLVDLGAIKRFCYPK